MIKSRSNYILKERSFLIPPSTATPLSPYLPSGSIFKFTDSLDYLNRHLAYIMTYSFKIQGVKDPVRPEQEFLWSSEHRKHRRGFVGTTWGIQDRVEVFENVRFYRHQLWLHLILSWKSSVCLLLSRGNRSWPFYGALLLTRIRWELRHVSRQNIELWMDPLCWLQPDTIDGGHNLARNALLDENTIFSYTSQSIFCNSSSLLTGLMICCETINALDFMIPWPNTPREAPRVVSRWFVLRTSLLSQPLLIPPSIASPS